jgi:hypothetical protein
VTVPRLAIRERLTAASIKRYEAGRGDTGMTDTRPPLAAFADRIFDRVAEETGVPLGRLRTVTRRHQQGVRDLPGVDNIVYEWRTQFRADPLVHRTEEVYVLSVADHVWGEFADTLEASPPEREALETVHDRQARRLVGETPPLDDGALVLTRP